MNVDKFLLEAYKLDNQYIIRNESLPINSLIDLIKDSENNYMKVYSSINPGVKFYLESILKSNNQKRINLYKLILNKDNDQSKLLDDIKHNISINDKFYITDPLSIYILNKYFKDEYLKEYNSIIEPIVNKVIKETIESENPYDDSTVTLHKLEEVKEDYLSKDDIFAMLNVELEHTKDSCKELNKKINDENKYIISDITARLNHMETLIDELESLKH